MRQRGIKNKGLIFVISGPSGSGKTTLLTRLLQAPQLKRSLVKSISLTTRSKRSNEKEGVDYFFINDAHFRRLRQGKKILEWTKYLGYYYATPKDFVQNQLKKGKHIVLCLDFRGARKIQQLYPKNTVTIFIVPPSLKAIWERIRKRCHRTEDDEIRQRVELARQELLTSQQYDYRPVNKDLDQTVRELERIILKEIYPKTTAR